MSIAPVLKAPSSKQRPQDKPSRRRIDHCSVARSLACVYDRVSDPAPGRRLRSRTKARRFEAAADDRSALARGSIRRKAIVRGDDRAHLRCGQGHRQVGRRRLPERRSAPDKPGPRQRCRLALRALRGVIDAQNNNATRPAGGRMASAGSSRARSCITRLKINNLAGVSEPFGVGLPRSSRVSGNTGGPSRHRQRGGNGAVGNGAGRGFNGSAAGSGAAPDEPRPSAGLLRETRNERAATDEVHGQARIFIGNRQTTGRHGVSFR